MKKWTFAVVLLIAMAFYLCTTPALAQDNNQKKPRLSLQALFMSGFIAQNPGQFMWLPDGSGFYYQYQGALNKFDIATATSIKVTTMGEIQRMLMEGRAKRENAGMGDTNATGRFNRSATTMNPDGTLLLGLQDGDLYTYNLAENTINWLTDDAAVEQFQQFSPDGSKIAYVKNNDVWVYHMESGEENQLTSSGDPEIWNGVADWVYEEELSTRRAFWWSPDSKYLAYLRFDTRPVKTFYIIDHLNVRPDPEKQKFPLTGEDNSVVSLGVVDLEGKTTWMDTGDEDFYIYQCDWSSSGDFLTYRWMSRAQDRIELRAANPETGEYKTLVTEQKETWVNAKSNWLGSSMMLYFFDDDSFLWLSERSGWFHIYHFDKDGNLKAQLTDGEWMIDTLEAVNDTHAYFTGRKDHALEKHLYRVPLKGGEIEKLTVEPGTHNSDVSPDGKYFVANHSAIDAQPQVRVFSTDGTELAVLKDNANP